MKIQINNRITELMSPLKNDVIFLDLDADEILIINHKGCLRKVKIIINDGELEIIRDFKLLKSTKEIRKELEGLKNGFIQMV